MQPFLNVQDVPILTQIGKVAGAPYLNNADSIQIGSGNTGFRAVKGKGIWLGAKAFEDATFSVDMYGNLFASSATFPSLVTIQIFRQASIPVSGAVGDLWFDTDDGNKVYRSGVAGADAITAGEWELVRDTSIPFVFAQNGIPTATAIGDLWYDTDDNNKVYRAASAGADAITAGEWVLVNDLRAADALLKAGAAQNLTGDIQVGAGNVKIDGANKRILINDGSFDRILIGFQSGGF